MIQIPSYVIPPGKISEFIPEEDCRPLKSAGLGYTIMKALGARKELSPESMRIVRQWCREHCTEFPDVVPDERKLRAASFAERVVRPSQEALKNAVCYPGGDTKTSYHELYQMIWINKQWPELCRALANLP